MITDDSVEVTNSFRESFKDSIHRFKAWERQEKVNSANPAESKSKTKNLCSEHKRALEIICVNSECLKRICTNCALFGNHQGHQIKSEYDIVNYAENKTQEMLDVQKELYDSEQLLKRERWEVLLEKEIQNISEKLLKDIDNIYDNAVELIESERAKQRTKLIQGLSKMQAECHQDLQGLSEITAGIKDWKIR